MKYKYLQLDILTQVAALVAMNLNTLSTTFNQIGEGLAKDMLLALLTLGLGFLFSQYSKVIREDYRVEGYNVMIKVIATLSLTQGTLLLSGYFISKNDLGNIGFQELLGQELALYMAILQYLQGAVLLVLGNYIAEARYKRKAIQILSS